MFFLLCSGARCVRATAPNQGAHKVPSAKENGGKWGELRGKGKGARGNGLVGTSGAYYPLNHEWGYHPPPDTHWSRPSNQEQH